MSTHRNLPHPVLAAVTFITAYFLVSAVLGALVMAVLEAFLLEPNPNGKSTAWGVCIFGLKATASVGFGYIAGLAVYVSNSHEALHRRTRSTFWPALLSAGAALVVSPILGLLGAMALCITILLWIGLGFTLGWMTLKW